MKQQFFIPLFALVFIGGCAHFESAKPNTPNIKTGSSAAKLPNVPVKEVVLSKWWLAFNDPTLTALIDEAMAQNYDIALATHRIEEARAQNQFSRAGLGPALVAGAKVSQNQLSENGAMPITKLPGVSRDQTVYQYGFDASWEIDVFGGLKNQIDATDAAIKAQIYGREATKMSIAAEIGRNYFELNNTTRQLAATREYLGNLDQSIALLKIRVQKGDISQKDIDETIAKRENYESQIPTLEAKRRDLCFAIATLLGKPPESTLYLLSAPAQNVQIFAFPVGQRAELLERRPDIQAAEAKLQMTASQIAATKAEYYPKFTISAHAGWETMDLNKAFDYSSLATTIVPGIQWRIFDSGRVTAQVNAAEARDKQAMDEYSKSVITALSDSERALNGYKAATDTIAAKQDAINAQNEFYQHQLRRFKAGDISKLELLDAQRSLKDLQIQNIQIEAQAQSQLISLFKALGGGWDNK